MTLENNIPIIIEIPTNEQKELDKLIKTYRKKYIRTSQEIVEKVFVENQLFLTKISKGEVSKSIAELREIVWAEYLKDEVEFNIILMQDLYKVLKTPKQILDTLLNQNITELKGKELQEEVIKICGEYAGRVYPYIYKIALSNTNSRRSRAGKTFESIIYKVYECLNYSFDSQGKVGRKTFTELGLGKKVDSILPSVKAYEKRRNKTIVGTMKTSLRERWQEVAEEIERTKIPEIHLLTVDENISMSKAQEMNNHNIIIVVYDWIANSDKLKAMKNIISFEEYLFEEIPSILKFWKDE
ncbi:MAG: type II restriction endonuclease [Flavobacteriales bacterium]